MEKELTKDIKEYLKKHNISEEEYIKVREKLRKRFENNKNLIKEWLSLSTSTERV